MASAPDPMAELYNMFLDLKTARIKFLLIWILIQFKRLNGENKLLQKVVLWKWFLENKHYLVELYGRKLV
jgi:hypothetical protein